MDRLLFWGGFLVVLLALGGGLWWVMQSAKPTAPAKVASVIPTVAFQSLMYEQYVLEHQ